jgi:hypothetical protein
MRHLLSNCAAKRIPSAIHFSLVLFCLWPTAKLSAEEYGIFLSARKADLKKGFQHLVVVVVVVVVVVLVVGTRVKKRF